MTRDEEETDVEEVENCLCIKETKDAILVRLPTKVEVWIPKSVVHQDSEVYGEAWHGDDRHRGKLVVHRWWAEAHGVG